MRPYFLPKTAENGGISNTFVKSTALGPGENQARGGAFFRFDGKSSPCLSFRKKQTPPQRKQGEKVQDRLSEAMNFELALIRTHRLEITLNASASFG